MPKITISAQHTVRYSQIREVSDETFARYQAMITEYDTASRPRQRELDRELERMADGIIDFSDVFDADDLEDIEIDLYADEDAALTADKGTV